MFNPIKIEIIKAFGSKELSFGCVIKQELEIETCDQTGEHWRSGSEKLYSYFTEINSPCIPLEINEENKILMNEYDLVFDNEKDKILGHIPELFPDVARELSKNGYVLELLKVDTIKSVLKISRFDMKKDILIPYKKLISLIDQDEQLTLIPLLNLFK